MADTPSKTQPGEDERTPSFRITAGKGLLITFKNGVTLSMQFGYGNYADNYSERSMTNPELGARGSNTAEIAAWHSDGTWIQLQPDEDVLAHVSPDEVLAYMNQLAARPTSKAEGRS